jgi:hypothetical protein
MRGPAGVPQGDLAVNADRFRDWLNERRGDISARALAAKDPQSAIGVLEHLYDSLTEQERQLADPVIICWATSDDPILRFDGLALIARFEISSALPALRRLADCLENAPGPSAPYDWAKVNRIIGRLTSASSEDCG